MFDLVSEVNHQGVLNVRTDRDSVLERGVIILKSPDGGYYALGVSNAGVLTATELATVAGIPVTSGNPDA